nr:MAG TPA: upper collar protein [Bacteriophage sp.]
MGIPVDYTYINAVNGQKNPSTIHTQNIALTKFFERYLIDDFIGQWKVELPETWAYNYTMYTLVYFGFFAVINTDKFGIIPQHCNLYGFDVMYQPTTAQIINPLIPNAIDARIHRDTELIKLFPDFGGIYDLIQFYAEKMALLSEGIDVNIINSKLSYIIGVDNKASAETFKKTIDKVTSGDACVVTGKELFSEDGTPMWTTFAQNLTQNYIASQQIEDLKKLKLMFDTDVGIPNANTEKKERLTDDEVNSNNIETQTKIELIADSLKESADRVNKMFGTNISFTLKFKESGGGVANVEGKPAINSRNV